MRSDSDIKRDVESELRWDPTSTSTDIAVAVRDGDVTLAGFVRSYSQRQQAEDDAKRVVGVAGVANDIEVRLPIVARRPDPQIAREAVAALRAELPYSFEHIKVVVEQGVLTLEGKVEWNYSRERAAQAVRRVRGVKSVRNLIGTGAEASTHRNQAQNRGGIPPECRIGCEPDRGPGRGKQCNFARHRTLMGRARRSRAGRLDSSRSGQGG